MSVRSKILEQASEADKGRLRYAWSVHDAIQADDLDHLGLPELRARTNLLHDAVASLEALEGEEIPKHEPVKAQLRRLRERHEKTKAKHDEVNARVKESQRLRKRKV